MRDSLMCALKIFLMMVCYSSFTLTLHNISSNCKKNVKMLVAGHNKKLEESIISETSGNLKRLLVALLQANRPEGNTIDRRKARNDAKALFEAGEKKFGTDESRFNVILCSRYISNYVYKTLYVYLW